MTTAKTGLSLINHAADVLGAARALMTASTVLLDAFPVDARNAHLAELWQLHIEIEDKVKKAEGLIARASVEVRK